MTTASGLIQAEAELGASFPARPTEPATSFRPAGSTSSAHRRTSWTSSIVARIACASAFSLSAAARARRSTTLVESATARKQGLTPPTPSSKLTNRSAAPCNRTRPTAVEPIKEHYMLARCPASPTTARDHRDGATLTTPAGATFVNQPIASAVGGSQVRLSTTCPCRGAGPICRWPVQPEVPRRDQEARRRSAREVRDPDSCRPVLSARCRGRTASSARQRKIFAAWPPRRRRRRSACRFSS